MRISCILVSETTHPMIPEGIYTLEEFETLSSVAASVTSPIEDSEVYVTVYFTDTSLESTVQGHLHINQEGDRGLMDWIGSAIAVVDDESIVETLGKIERVIH